MDINFEWPGDLDHETLNELFTQYAKLEVEFLRSALEADPRLAVLEGEV